MNQMKAVVLEEQHIRQIPITAYSGEATDLPAPVLSQFINDVAEQKISEPITGTYMLDEIVQAHYALEAGQHSGKLVVVIPHD
jgi:NADPH:quinone reductase-like Zn-dependent oxidoreductase